MPSLLRALVACGWFGIQTWIGGSSLHQMAQVVAPASLAAASPLPVLGITAAELACFLTFWAAQVLLLPRAGGLLSTPVCQALPV